VISGVTVATSSGWFISNDNAHMELVYISG